MGGGNQQEGKDFVIITRNKFYAWVAANILVILGFAFEAGIIHTKVNNNYERVEKIVDILIGAPVSNSVDTVPTKEF